MTPKVDIQETTTPDGRWFLGNSGSKLRNGKRSRECRLQLAGECVDTYHLFQGYLYGLPGLPACIHLLSTIERFLSIPREGMPLDETRGLRSRGRPNGQGLALSARLIFTLISRSLIERRLSTRRLPRATASSTLTKPPLV